MRKGLRLQKRQIGFGFVAVIAGVLLAGGLAAFQSALLGKPLALRVFWLPLILGAGGGLVIWLWYLRMQGALTALKDNKARLQELLKQRTAELEESNRLIQRLAIQDEVTGIASRRLFEQYFDREWRRAVRNLTTMSLILCEIDRWKSFIENTGQAEAENCLRRVVGVMKANLARPADFVARYGDNRIAVLLPETPQEGAVVVAERLRAQVAALKIPNGASKFDNCITASIGLVTCIPGRFDSYAAFMRAGEQALLHARRAGHNRVQIGKFQQD